MTYPAYSYLVNGQIREALLYVFNNYFIMGSFWLLVGATVYMTVYGKTQNNLTSLVAVSIYFLCVSPLMAVSIYMELSSYIILLLIFTMGAAVYLLFVK